MPYPPKAWLEGEKGKAADLNRIEQALAVLSTVVNVKEAPYGAKGDNTTDDAAALQAAYTAAGPPGEIAAVFHPAGYYYVSKGLKVPEQVTILGANRRVTALEAHGEFNLLELTGSAVVVEGLFLKSATAQTTKGAAIDFSHGVTADVQLRNLQVGSNFWNGLYIVGETEGVGASIGNVLLENVTFEDTAAPVKSYGNAAIVSGSSTRRISVLRMVNIFGFAATKADMPAWFQVNNTDSFFITNGGFQNGVLGLVTGAADTSTKKTTNLCFEGVWFDGGTEGMAAGFKLSKLFNSDLNVCHAQGCNPGVIIEAEVSGLNINGGQYYHNFGAGIRITSSASPTYSVNITGAQINCNNESNSGEVKNQCGIFIEESAGGINITGCTIGNPALQSGNNFQKYAIVFGKKCANIGLYGNNFPKNKEAVFKKEGEETNINGKNAPTEAELLTTNIKS